jgi:hemin uptake protein HemP
MADKSGEDRSAEAMPRAKMPRKMAREMPRTISSRELLRGERLVIVQHEQESYRLQLTASGKLILTK